MNYCSDEVFIEFNSASFGPLRINMNISQRGHNTILSLTKKHSSEDRQRNIRCSVTVLPIKTTSTTDCGCRKTVEDICMYVD